VEYPNSLTREQWLDIIENTPNRNPFYVQPAPEQPIWRYMDFAKFVDLIDRAKLFFPSAAHLKNSDPFEGTLTAETVRVRALPIDQRLRHMAHDPKSFGYTTTSSQANPEALDQFTRSVLGEHSDLEWQRHWTFISCWHMNEHESAAMWKLYAESNQAIAVQSTFGRLKRCLRPHVMPPHGEPILGTVYYIDYVSEVIPHYNHLAHFFHKRKSFAHEKELRAVVQDLPLMPASWDAEGRVTGRHYDYGKATESGRSLDMDVDHLIETIRIAPGAAPWLRALVHRLLIKYGLDKPVRSSDLDHYPVY
jgi:hypothetical protein